MINKILDCIKLFFEWIIMRNKDKQEQIERNKETKNKLIDKVKNAKDISDLFILMLISVFLSGCITKNITLIPKYSYEKSYTDIEELKKEVNNIEKLETKIWIISENTLLQFIEKTEKEFGN